MNDDLDGLHKSRRRWALLRAISVLVVLFFLQGGVAYGTLQLFLSLPATWTGIVDDADIERDAHQGTVYMIDKAIENEPTKTVQQVLAELQPYFHFRLNYVENANNFS